MSVLVTIAVVLVLGFAAGAVYDRLIRLRRKVQSSWRELEGRRSARQEVIGRIAAVCAGRAADPVAVEAVVSARRQAAGAVGPADAARKEGALGEAVSRLLTASAIAMDAEVGALAKELGEAERTYRLARQVYNDVARKYNTATTVVPGSLVARFGNFRRAEQFE